VLLVKISKCNKLPETTNFRRKEMNYSTEEKAMWLDDWRQSGKKAWAYAKENGLIPQTFTGWVNREARKTTGFVEIHPKVKPQCDRSEILIEKGDVKIHIPLLLGSMELRAVIEGLGVSL